MLTRVRSKAWFCRTGRLGVVFIQHCGSFLWELRRGVVVPFSRGLFLTLGRVGIYANLSEAMNELARIEMKFHSKE